MCKPLFFIQTIVVFWISDGISYSSQILNGTYWNNSSDTWSRVCTFLWEHYPCQVPWHNSCLMAVLTLAREEGAVLRCPWTGFARFGQLLIDQSWRSSSGAGWSFLPSGMDALFVNDNQGSVSTLKDKGQTWYWTSSIFLSYSVLHIMCFPLRKYLTRLESVLFAENLGHPTIL